MKDTDQKRKNWPRFTYFLSTGHASFNLFQR